MKNNEHAIGKEDPNRPGELVFSLEILREASLGNIDFENQMLRLFLEQSVEGLAKIKHFYAEQDWNSVSSQAHQLKSSFGMFLMDTSLLDRVEKGTDQPDFEKKLRDLEAQIESAHRHIHTLIN